MNPVYIYLLYCIHNINKWLYNVSTHCNIHIVYMNTICCVLCVLSSFRVNVHAVERMLYTWYIHGVIVHCIHTKKPRHKTHYMSMNTIIQINSYFDILIYTQRSLYVKRYSNVYITFHRHKISLFRHLSTRRLFDIFLQYTTPFVSTRFWLISTLCLYLSNMFNVEHEVQTYMYRHYLTLFDIIWHNLISFFVYFYQCLSNVFDTARGTVGCRIP